MNINIPLPKIINLPYGHYERNDFEHALRASMEPTMSKWPQAAQNDSTLEQALKNELQYLVDYPTVYIVYSNKKNHHSQKIEYTVYVGETNDIVHRTKQHLNNDPKTRSDWKYIADAIRTDPDAFQQYVITHPWFNKSLTLDIENQLMHYLSSSESIKRLNNRRTNAQGKYYTSEQFDKIFSQIWLELHHENPVLFPAEEIIRDSALFKASPFHQLSSEQKDAEEMILTQLMSALYETEDPTVVEHHVPKLIFVQGAAGTGKTVLLSHLFYRISIELKSQYLYNEEQDEDVLALPSAKSRALSSYILVNHKEQVHVYNQIATKLGLQKKSNDIVLLPSQFINRFSKKNDHGRGNPAQPEGLADIVLVDEAHLLATQGNQGYSGKNQLYDILRRAKVVIAVFDPDQILQTRQQ